jgi:hypothetical protein
MQLEKYDCQTTADGESFTFESVGPKGVIRKIVNYQPLPWQIGPIQVVNLAFGDWNFETRNIDELVISNNRDRDKVLATVAFTALDYMAQNGRVAIHIKGITPAKTRLYQMGINAHRAEIEQLYIVYGQLEGEWCPFESGYNYESFLILKK